MDMYKAVTEKRFDWRTERPSLDDSVFWRETGMKEDEDEVEALEGAGSSVATDMAAVIRRGVPFTAGSSSTNPSSHRPGVGGFYLLRLARGTSSGRGGGWQPDLTLRSAFSKRPSTPCAPTAVRT